MIYLALIHGLEDQYGRLTQKLAASRNWAYLKYNFEYFLKVPSYLPT